MGDPDLREKRAKKFKNPVVKELRNTKGPFKPRVVEPRDKYKREKVSIKNYEDYNEEE
jgi:hypothetical protein